MSNICATCKGTGYLIFARVIGEGCPNCEGSGLSRSVLGQLEELRELQQQYDRLSKEFSKVIETIDEWRGDLEEAEDTDVILSLQEEMTSLLKLYHPNYMPEPEE